MPYRAPDPDRTMHSAREAAALRAACTHARIRWIAREVSRIDEQIGYWSTRFADGATVPPHVWSLVAEKQNIEIGLRSLVCEELATYPDAATLVDQGLGDSKTSAASLPVSMAGSPLLGGFLVGVAFSCTAAFSLTCALCLR